MLFEDRIRIYGCYENKMNVMIMIFFDGLK